MGNKYVIKVIPGQKGVIVCVKGNTRSEMGNQSVITVIPGQKWVMCVIRVIPGSEVGNFSGVKHWAQP